MAPKKPRTKTTGKFATRQELARAVWDLFHEGGSDAGIAREVSVSAGVVADILRNGPRMKRRVPEQAAAPAVAEEAASP